MTLLEPLQLPEKVEVDQDSYTSTYGKFEIGPLEPGFGTTIANTLRRVLLSAIQGAAVRYVKIEGLHHEFTPIPGCESDFIDLILRLKKLVVQSETIQETKLVLEHKGIGKITAAEIQETADITIINKDLVLAEMTEDMEFHMEIWVGIGRGYVPSDLQNVEDFPTGVIPIDSIYSPITRVNYSIEKQRVGQRIDYDKIIMEIYSDGSIDCRDALYLSAKILRDLYDKLVLFEKEPEYIEEVQMDPELEELEKIFNMNVNELELSVRCSNCLAAAKIDTIGELVSKNENEMLKYRNFGKKSLEEINALLEKYNLGLGYDVEGKSEEIAEARTKVTVR
ncbi:MAG: DNA-directed RNA polymerase subunit alpha [Candidatus Stygibacter australis]|nr:DNA-directed RNA polymerase subunit alpha [Candidatus Stygibacter australis]MDP8322204.1 DNA-directed RNA polymerase subunit alpha [Candidatus Stygibacter australis]